MDAAKAIADILIVEDEIAHAEAKTHNEHYPSRTHLDAWLRELGKGRLLRSDEASKLSDLKGCLQALIIRVDDNAEPYFASCKNAWSPELQKLLTPANILDYKRRYWATGSIDHEDVLYFAYQLLHKLPVLCRFLSDKFPYLFIDEFLHPAGLSSGTAEMDRLLTRDLLLLAPLAALFLVLVLRLLLGGWRPLLRALPLP